ncbi:MAG: peptide deformylase [Deltaproteobacteria bacterium]|nr:peptide deformylase [Deltaproteobacteria bacterium]MBW1833624.1 peptide deformylase [Deltaproteobacteria bacterium]MBW2165425.1 peptide deformylase [Deltaproteobacteria bacterium]
MPMLNILTYPDKFLGQPAKPVKNIDGTTQKIIEDMSFTMYNSKGVGLAAIQVGFDKSLILYDVSQCEEKRSLQILINPRIIESNGRIISEKEGCLSVPDLRADVKRAESILVEAFDREGKPMRIDAEGYLAIVLQHEIDHLNGILFIDHISALKRELYKRRIKKQLRK